jgi:hypothetical protein
MFESGVGRQPVQGVRALVASLASLQGTDDGQRIDLISELESLKSAASAAQARLAVAFADSQEAVQQAGGAPARERGRGVAAQIALARRESPHRGSRHLGFARAMVHEMPGTMAHLTAGRVSEWRATIVCRETAVLSLEDRERELGLPLTGDPDAGMAWMMHRWASGRQLEEVLRGSDMAAGDFVRRCKQVVDLLGQIGDAAPEPMLRGTARKAIDAVMRGVVAADRLD